jgi:hypothetical protein
VVAGRRAKKSFESCSAGHHDVFRVAAVQIHRFALLDVVPDDHAVGLDAHQPLVRQVVPTERNEDDGYAERCAALT